MQERLRIQLNVHAGCSRYLWSRWGERPLHGAEYTYSWGLEGHRNIRTVPVAYKRRTVPSPVRTQPPQSDQPVLDKRTIAGLGPLSPVVCTFLAHSHEESCLRRPAAAARRPGPDRPLLGRPDSLDPPPFPSPSPLSQSTVKVVEIRGESRRIERGRSLHCKKN